MTHELRAIRLATNHDGFNELMISLLRELKETPYRDVTGFTRKNCTERLRTAVKRETEPIHFVRAFRAYRVWQQSGREVSHYLNDALRSHVWETWVEDVRKTHLAQALEDTGWLLLPVRLRRKHRGGENFRYKVISPRHRLVYVYSGKEELEEGERTVIPITPPPEAQPLQQLEDGTQVYSYNFPLIR